MKIETLKQEDIKGLIGNQNSFYIIPDYQRPYSWEEENIIDFWDDITKAYENKNDSYFLGSFIIIKKKELNGFEVVDGQQRLTTITLFLAVLRDFFQANGRTDLSEKIQNEFIKKEEKYRLSVRVEDRAYFENSILKEIGSLDRYRMNSLRPHYKNAIRLLEQFMMEKKEQVKSDINYFQGLYDYLLNEVFVIVVVAEDIASAYTIFETINQRGKELLVQDLLKNYLLKKLQDEVATHNKEKPDFLKDFEEEKLSFISMWQRVENSGEDLEDMLNYHRTVLTGINPKKDLFKEITDYIRDKNITAEDFMVDWQKTIEAFLSLKKDNYINTLNEETKKCLSMLWLINHSYWVPVIIAARRMNMPIEDFQILVFELEKMYALFWISGYSSVKIKYPSWALIKDFINQNKNIADIKEFIKSTMTENSVCRRSNEEVHGNCYGRSWCRYVLAKYEYALADDTMAKKFNFNKIQIEHILPQTMEADYWKQRFTSEEHDQLVNSIGNLTLLAGGIKEKRKSKNQAASNKPFDKKLKIYSGETLKDGISALNMTRELDKYEEWTPFIIRNRQKLIIDKLKEVWRITEEDIKNEELFRNPNISDSDSISTEEKTIFTTAKGNFSDDKLKYLFKETLNRDTPLTPRLIIFFKTLLSENRFFSREELKKSLFENGQGEDVGRAGAYLSNISQFLTKTDNGHLRQIIEFESADHPGAKKDNYKIADQYRDLIGNILN